MNIEEILFCGKLSEEIYDDDTLGFVPIKDLRFGVRGLNDKIYIVFRGTKNTKNALRDITVLPPYRFDGFLTHRGFALAAEELLKHVRVHYDDLEVVFTGHSFGATTAALFAYHYGCRAITFGCPAFNFWFASRPNIDHFRIICDDDPVPKVPLLLGKHTNKPELILSDGDCSWIDIEDHAMSEYNKRLNIWAKEVSYVG